eukprot:tig00000093_g3496.t1
MFELLRFVYTSEIQGGLTALELVDLIRAAHFYQLPRLANGCIERLALCENLDLRGSELDEERLRLQSRLRSMGQDPSGPPEGTPEGAHHSPPSVEYTSPGPA